MNQLEAIRQRLEAATPGPWTHTGSYAVWRSAPFGSDAPMHRTDITGGDDSRYLEDAKLVSHAAEDIALLLEVVEAAVFARDLDDYRYSSNADSDPWLPFWLALGNLTEEVPA